MKGREGQKGFTLVELAVVMIIVGLLIGGILKGQELITNAQVASTITQAKGIDAAVSTFRDSYRALPGDIATATTRLPNCPGGTACAADGNGDSRITTAAGVAIQPDAAMVAGSEAQVFFVHLAAAEMITGVQNENDVNMGSGLPESAIGGGYGVGFFAGGAALGANANASGGHYLSLRSSAAAPAAAGPLTAAQAARIDSKMDDGSPETGSVFPENDTATCVTVVGGSDVYDEANNPVGCNLYIKIQG